MIKHLNYKDIAKMKEIFQVYIKKRIHSNWGHF